MVNNYVQQVKRYTSVRQHVLYKGEYLQRERKNFDSVLQKNPLKNSNKITKKTNK